MNSKSVTTSTNLPALIGCTLTTAWLLRNSVLTYWTPAEVTSQLCYAVLLTPALLLPLSPPWVSGVCIAMFLATGIGSWCADPASNSLLRYAGWVLLASVVGPIFSGRAFQAMRHAAWRAGAFWVEAIGLASFAWWLLGMPLMGRGDFTGVMNHANLLGPLATLGALGAAHRWLRNGRRSHLVSAAFCLFACVASGSRLALTAAGAALLLMAIAQFTSNPRSHALLLGILSLLAISCFVSPAAVRVSNALRTKGAENTRTHLWTARWAEFQAHPLFGIGIGLGEGEGAEWDLSGRISVEPGSSYLAVLSMTGLTGALALGTLLAHILWRAREHKSRFAPGELQHLAAVGVFLGIHAIGEGWIFAVGSPLAFIFWLWLGYLNDRSYAPERHPSQLRPNPVAPPPRAAI